jgi:hypothetical protein
MHEQVGTLELQIRTFHTHAICLTLVLSSTPDVCSTHHQDSSHQQASIAGLPPNKKPILSRFPTHHSEKDHLRHGPPLHQLQAAEGVGELYQHKTGKSFVSADRSCSNAVIIHHGPGMHQFSKIKFSKKVPTFVGNVETEIGRNRQRQLYTDHRHHHQLQWGHSSDSGDLVPVRVLSSHLFLYHTDSIQLGDEAQLSQQHQVMEHTHVQGLVSQSHAGICPIHVAVTYLHYHVTVEVPKGKHLLISHGLLVVLCLHQPDLPHQLPSQGHQRAGAGEVHHPLQPPNHNQHLEAQHLGCEQVTDINATIHPSRAYLRIPTNIMRSTTW